MIAVEFNVNGLGQHLVVEKGDGGLNPRSAITVEAILVLLEDGDAPTVFCLPAKERWETPFVAWRLGFFAGERRPEFQVTVEGDDEPTTVRAEQTVGLYQMVHITGSYDGRALRLYVDGKLAGEVEKTGALLASLQKPTMGARSSSDMGGEFIGRLYESRIWSLARTAEEVDTWKDKTLQFPAPEGLEACYSSEPSIGADEARILINKGMKPLQISLASFITAYAAAYTRHSPALLSGIDEEWFPRAIHTTIFIKAENGFVVIYEPAPPDYLEHLGAVPESPSLSGFLYLNMSQFDIAETIQGLSGNRIKIGLIERNAGLARVILPEDNNNAVDWMVSDRLTQAGVIPPQIQIIEEDPSTIDNEIPDNGRIRIISPLVRLENGIVTRAYTWLFADIWYGELSLELARKGQADILAMNDILDLGMLSAVVPAQNDEAIKIAAKSPQLALEKAIVNFQALIDKEDVDEVKDILPFLAKRENWLILRPTCEEVWPEKMLGNKWRVDFIVRDGDGRYVAIEVESPKKRLYKAGSAVEPFQEWMHAEQQVRDYCNFIDMNRDYIEREEALPGILRPTGLVIIGRRNEISVEGRRKLAERNGEGGRYQTITFDDLIDQAKSVAKHLRELVSPSR